jgi:hypothetical protein
MIALGGTHVRDDECVLGLLSSLLLVSGSAMRESSARCVIRRAQEFGLGV